MNVIECIEMIKVAISRGVYPELGKTGAYKNLTPKEKTLVDNILKSSSEKNRLVMVRNLEP